MMHWSTKYMYLPSMKEIDQKLAEHGKPTNNSVEPASTSKKLKVLCIPKLGQVQCSHTITRYHGCKASSGETLPSAAETLPVQASWLAQSSRQQWFWVYYRHATATSHAPRPLKRNWRHPEQVLMLSSQGNQLCSSCNSKVVRFLADTDLKWHLSEVVLILETVLAFMMNLKYAWQHGVKNVDWGFQCGSEPSSGNTCS